MRNYKFLTLTLLLAFTLLVSGCSKHPSYLGYVEARLTYISSPYSGKLTVLSVERGQPVKAGDPLFQLEQQPESSELSAALATVNQTTADLADKMKGDRPSELDAISAQIAQAQAQVDYAKKDVDRKQQLVNRKVMEQNQLDLAMENLKVAEATAQQFQANLTTGKLAGREDQIQSLQAQLENAKANLAKAQWILQQKTVSAPVDAQVFDTYYRVGEQVSANQAVLSLLAPADIKVVFYVDEPTLSKIKVGQKVAVDCDGCRSGITAVIRFISPYAEYTPPIIYSRSARTKLVYEVEAQFEHMNGKKSKIPNAGEPVEVSLL